MSKKRILVNALSLNMVEGDVLFDCRKVSIKDARQLLSCGFESAVGHEDLARMLSRLLGFTVQARRVNVAVAPGDELVIAQYSGPRLEPGTTTLPEGAKIVWWYVIVQESGSIRELSAEVKRLRGLLGTAGAV